jgi:hypothetical protein
MKTHRVLVVAALAGVLVFTSVQRANAIDPYYQDLLSNMLSGLVSGTPYGPSGNLPYGPYGTPSYDPYGNPTGGAYGTPPYGPYGNAPYYDPSGLGGGGYYGPARGSYGSYPYDSYRGRDSRYRYQERLGSLNEQYDKAMRRLDRQEYEASTKAYRKSYGDPSRYSEQMAKIDRKYGYKRYKVERNTARDYRKLSGRY